MKMCVRLAGGLLLVSPSAFAAPGDILFQDDFETGSIASYTVVESLTDTGDDSQITYGFDYGSFGFSGITGTGLLLETDDSITAFVNGLTITTPISIKFDAIASAVSGGSTEYVVAGVYDTETLSFNSDVINDGAFIAASTDSDFTGGGDFAVYESFDGAAPTALSFMDAADTADSGTAFATILPEVPGQAAPGVLEGRVAEFEVIVDGDRIQWFIDGFLLTDVTTSKVATGGVGIGINDPFPGFNNGGGAGSGTGTAFAIDNLVISEAAAIPEPSTLLLAAAGLSLLATRRRAASA